MKKFILLSALAIFSLNSMAAEMPKACYKKAEEAVSDEGVNSYDQDGIETLNCVYPSNKYITICNVSASKGDGAATDSYYVILNRACTKALRVELTGEE